MDTKTTTANQVREVFVRLLGAWIERPRRWAGRSHAIVAVPPIERTRRMTKPGSRPCARRDVFLL